MTRNTTTAEAGTSRKCLRSSLGEIPIQQLQYRNSYSELNVLTKYKKNISAIEGKIIAMYAIQQPMAARQGRDAMVDGV